jgi:hypothetical protein
MKIKSHLKGNICQKYFIRYGELFFKLFSVIVIII